MTLDDVFVEDQPKPNGPTLLLIDDERINLLTAQALLNAAGFEVVTVTSGEEALQVFPDQHFDGVITDIHMPIMDGFELARKLAALKDCPVPIAALTADPQISIQDSAISHVLSKPLDTSAVSAWLAKTNP